MRLGLDFGTSNSSLAVSDAGPPRLLPLDPFGGSIMPSVLYVRRDGSSFVGREAIGHHLSDNRARGPVRREFRKLAIRMDSSDPGQPTVEAHIFTDVSSPGRFFQALKSFLGDPLLLPTNVFGTARGLSELIAVLFAHVRESAAAATGAFPSDIVIGRPVEFVGGRDVEARALDRLREAAELAGFRGVAFEQEPVAAARAADIRSGTALVFDFGGGTLDLCIVKREPSALKVLASAGRDVGGDRFTELLIEDVVAPRLGSRATWSVKRLRLPSFITNSIRDWHALSALNEKTLLDALDDLIRAGAPRRELSALRSAMELQLGYEIFATVDSAKCEISASPATVVSFHRGDVDVDARVTRARFERLARRYLVDIDGLVTRVLASAELSAGSVDTVVCTGGSSQMPAVRALLGRRFPGATIRDAEAFSTVALGLALAG